MPPFEGRADRETPVLARVLHVQKVSGIAGSERHLLDLLAGLAARGLVVRICVLAEGAAQRFVDRLLERGIDPVVIRAGTDLNAALPFRIATEIRRFRPDVVHTHLIHGNVYGQLAARACRAPGVLSMHGSQAFFARYPYRLAARLAGRLAVRTIAISDHVRRFVESLQLAPAGTTRVIPYGIDTSEWQFGADARSRARAAFGLSSDDVAVGIASRLIEHKGHDFLIQGIAKARHRAPGLRLLVAGEGPIRARLEQQALHQLPGDGARFLGFVSDIRKFMNACDVFAVPTSPQLQEGFGLAALEAMAAGRPVVATSVGSLPEVVVDKETGFLVRPDSVEQLADVLSELAHDQWMRERMGARGAERARSAFRLDSMVDQTIDVYEEVAALFRVRSRP